MLHASTTEKGEALHDLGDVIASVASAKNMSMAVCDNLVLNFDIGRASSLS